MTQEDFNKLIVNFIFTSGVPLHTVELPSFQRLVLAGRPGLKVPSRNLVSTRLLNEAFNEEWEILLEELKHASFLILVIDDCTLDGHLKMINYVLCGQNITHRLYKVVMTGDTSQTTEYIAKVTLGVADEVEHVIGKVGFVTGVTTDNVKVMQTVWEILETERGIVCGGCGAHTMSLLLQGIGKLETVKGVVEKATHVAHFFRNNGLLFARFEEVRKTFVKNNWATTAITRHFHFQLWHNGILPTIAL